jgi:four helix bundle protein
MVYRFSALFPKSEIFGLTSQMRRCAVSVTSNIVEGFARKGTKEKIQFYYQAKASLTELQSQLEICRDLDFLTNEDYIQTEERVEECHRLLGGLIKNQKG